MRVGAGTDYMPASGDISISKQLPQVPAGVLEVMGAPLAGSNLRASVLTGGGLYFKGWRPKLRSRRLQMMFPLTGSARKGLVSLECKKKQVRCQVALHLLGCPMVTPPCEFT